LKLQRDKLKQYQKKIEHVLTREKEIAKEALAAGNKSRALTALRQRKYQEQVLGRTDAQLETLQSLVSSIEFSLVEKSILLGLQQGNAVLKEIHKEMTVEMVEKLMGETEDAVAYQREIDETLQSKMSAEEEDAVQLELEAMVAEQEKARRAAEPEVPTVVPELPSAPTQEPVEAPTPVEEEEEEEPVAETRQRVLA
ncbi:Snf7 family, partial [Mrakia frigida]|uniref:ESCRT-III subunit protein VPS20 n=1 Tax=Mrakia frigida TaxID=29902 RepID=UPI003FCC120F